MNENKLINLSNILETNKAYFIVRFFTAVKFLFALLRALLNLEYLFCVQNEIYRKSSILYLGNPFNLVKKEKPSNL